MAIILIEEVLMGLDDVKATLQQAVTTLEDITEDMSPALGNNVKGVLESALLQPLKSRLTVLDELLEELAAMV